MSAAAAKSASIRTTTACVVSDNNARSVTRLDATTGVIVATTKVGTSPSDGVRGPDGLEWIRNDGEGTIWRIDPATNAVVDTISVGPHPFAYEARSATSGSASSRVIGSGGSIRRS